MPAEFHAIEMRALKEHYESFPYTVSQACERYFEGRAASSRIRQSADMRKSVSAGLGQTPAEKQRLSERSLKAENSKITGFTENFTASLHTVQDGRNSAEVLNYYTGEMMTIPLDARYSAAKKCSEIF